MDDEDKSLGYVKDWRCSLHWPWFRHPPTAHLFRWCLLRASHKAVRKVLHGQVVDLEPGQFITGRHAAAKETGLSVKQVRTAKANLQGDGAITWARHGANPFSIVTVYNYANYQADDETKGQGRGQPGAKEWASPKAGATTQNDGSCDTPEDDRGQGKGHPPQEGNANTRLMATQGAKTGASPVPDATRADANTSDAGNSGKGHKQEDKEEEEEEETKKKQSAAAPRNEFADAFAKEFDLAFPEPYPKQPWPKADFVQLARWQKQYPLVTAREFATAAKAAWKLPGYYGRVSRSIKGFCSKWAEIAAEAKTDTWDVDSVIEPNYTPLEGEEQAAYQADCRATDALREATRAGKGRE
ncbi:MAG TPA: hypothetical protein VNA25_00950 [Phycisphaerae bacterium]|nr:hypothetical protein [Phycisphaerae bacterium]